MVLHIGYMVIGCMVNSFMVQINKIDGIHVHVKSPVSLKVLNEVMSVC